MIALALFAKYPPSFNVFRVKKITFYEIIGFIQNQTICWILSYIFAEVYLQLAV